MTEPTELKLGGKPLVLRPELPSLVTVRTYLDSLPDNELKYSQDVEAATGVRTATFCHPELKLALVQYRGIVAKRMVWGNPRAIAELRRQQAELRRQQAEKL